jgi:hypothetical protein
VFVGDLVIELTTYPENVPRSKQIETTFRGYINDIIDIQPIKYVEDRYLFNVINLE